MVCFCSQPQLRAITTAKTATFPMQISLGILAGINMLFGVLHMNQIGGLYVFIFGWSIYSFYIFHGLFMGILTALADTTNISERKYTANYYKYLLMSVTWLTFIISVYSAITFAGYLLVLRAQPPLQSVNLLYGIIIADVILLSIPYTLLLMLVICWWGRFLMTV